MTRSPLLAGLLAGAAGTVTLNVVTYLDMAVRGRASSSMPAKAAGQLAEDVGIDLGDTPTATHRTQGLGPLLGYVTGLGVGLGYGALRRRRQVPLPLAALGLAAAATVGSDGPLTALGLTDPRSWPASSWAADAVPHLAYGVVTAATYAYLER